MPVGEQVAILYCGTRGLMAGIPVESVREFQDLFLDRLRTEHQADVIDILASGIINDDVTAIIEQVARQIVKGMERICSFLLA